MLLLFVLCFFSSSYCCYYRFHYYLVTFFQVSVECIERGELLAQVRDKYSDLLNRVPNQVRGLDAILCCKLIAGWSKRLVA